MRARRRRGDRESLVDRARRARIDGGERVRHVDGGRPRGDRAAFSREDERGDARLAVAREREIRSLVEDDSGRFGGPGRARGDRYDQRLNDAVAVVERGRLRAVVGDPNEAVRVERHAPAVLQIRVGVRRGHGAIGDDDRHLETCRRRHVVVRAAAARGDARERDDRGGANHQTAQQSGLHDGDSFGAVRRQLVRHL